MAAKAMLAENGVEPQDVAGGTSNIVVNVNGRIQLLR